MTFRDLSPRRVPSLRQWRFQPSVLLIPALIAAVVIGCKPESKKTAPRGPAVHADVRATKYRRKFAGWVNTSAGSLTFNTARISTVANTHPPRRIRRG